MRRLILSAFLLATLLSAQGVVVRRRVVAAASSSVTIDAVSSGTTTAGGAGVKTIADGLTVTSGRSNSAVIAVLDWNGTNTAAQLTGCTYNSVAMAPMWRVTDTIALQRTAAFIVAAGTGDGVSHNAVCTFTNDLNANGVTMWLASFYHVNQTSPARMGYTALVDATGSTSLTVTNAVSGDFVVDGISMYGGVPSTTQTSRGSVNNVFGNGYQVRFSSTASSVTGSTVMGYTWDAVERYAAFGAAAIAHE